jgi:hypothetical protein
LFRVWEAFPMERPQLSPFDDKTLLFRGWSIRKLGLCVKGKGITIYGGLGLSYVKKVCACPPSLSPVCLARPWQAVRLRRGLRLVEARSYASERSGAGSQGGLDTNVKILAYIDT